MQVLKLLLAYIEMPEDLSGELEETQRLLSYFDLDLAPHDVFWKDIVSLVDLAFPGDSFSPGRPCRATNPSATLPDF